LLYRKVGQQPLFDIGFQRGVRAQEINQMNWIVKGIGKGELKTGEKLPTVRQLASDAGVNTMTVNKAYQILKNEGFIRTDRRLGAFVSESIADDTDFTEKLESELELLSAEACLTGMSREEFLSMCDKMYSQMKPCTA
jgi:DNA-binding transcriptional regulator YhcF (GntR family)